MKKIIIVLAIVILAAVGGAYALTKKPAKTTDNTSQTTAPTTSTDTTDTTSAATITYTNSGFSPNKITVKFGDTITVKNNSSLALQFDSDPHPSHTDNTELNVGTVASGGSTTVKLTTKGTWGYHNHLNSTDTGSIVVE